MKKKLAIGAALLSAVMLLGACGAPPEPVAEVVEPGTADAPDTVPGETVEGGGTVVAEEGFTPCIVSDAGGFDDRSFNQSAFEGVTYAANRLGLSTFPSVQSTDDTQFLPNLDALVGQGCSLIVATGFAFAPAVFASATANPDVHYLLVDSDGFVDGNPPPENVKSVLYDTAQAAFLAGYVSAAFSSRDGGAAHVGTFGGMAFPTVTIFMDGFYQGVEYYNQQMNANVQITGWDGNDGSFTGGFQANQQALTTAQGIINQGVDVILPVGGPIYQSAVAAIHDAGRDVALVGVDQDLFFSDPTTQDIVLTSILKNIDVSVRDAILESAAGDWDPTPYIGTLANGGVGIAPFHNFEDQIPQDVRDHVAQLEQDIIAGTVVVRSNLS